RLTLAVLALFHVLCRLPPPPTSPPFPYTTLFRSHIANSRSSATWVRNARTSATSHTCISLRCWRGGSTRAAGLRGNRPQRNPAADRKSTRLNSSHSQISYAVFCLKKKKKQGEKTH